MSKSFILIPAILFTIYGFCEGIVCYHCYTNGKVGVVDARFVPCNELNLSASNTWEHPSTNARCVYEVVEIESTKVVQTWRTTSIDPCNPSTLPPGVKMLQCSFCGTDKCNLYGEGKGNETNSFTFNINANINLYIRQ